MKKSYFFAIVVLLLFSCKPKNAKEEKKSVPEQSPIVGTWKLVYGEIRENDSLDVKDLSKSDFIKIINDTHFAFFNQNKNNSEGFYGGAGTYELKGTDYIETLDFIETESYRGHRFPFTVEIKGDSLIQFGIEEIKEENIKRHIVEKYIRIK